jgi:hypothetical protein
MAMLTWRKPVGAQTAAWIFIGAGIAVALVGIVQGVFIDRPTAIELGVVVPESILIAAIAYALGLRPLLVIDHRGIVVRNFLRTTPIPWSIFMGVSSERIGLVIHTAAVRQMVAAVPAGGRKVQGKQRAELIAHEYLGGLVPHPEPGKICRGRPATSGCLGAASPHMSMTLESRAP